MSIASPRVIDKALLAKSLAELEQAVDNEDEKRAIELLSHIVPEYDRGSSADTGRERDRVSSTGDNLAND